MKKNSGFAIIYVLLVLFVLFALSLLISNITKKSIELSISETAKKQAFYIAEAGIEYSKKELAADPAWNTGFSNFPFVNSLGETIGYFNVSIETAGANISKITSVGNYKNYYDTIVFFYEPSLNTPAMFNHLILADSGINISADALISYYTDFSEYPTGQMPAGWTHRWATAGITFTIANDAFATGGKVLRKTLSNDLRTMLSFNLADGSQDIEILAKHKFSSVAAQIDYLFIRASGNSGSENNYSAIYLAGIIYLARRTNGIVAVLSSTGYVLANDTYYWTRLRAQGNNIRMKIWQDGLPEPGAWTFSVIDNTHISGWAGVGNLNNRQTDFDVVSFGFNGATAPSTHSAKPLLCYLEGNNVHSNDTMIISPNAITNAVNFTSVDTGDSYVNITSFDTNGYRNEALPFGQAIAGNFAFLENTNYFNQWYISGDATIGGVPWWNKNYRRRFKLRVTNNNTQNVNVQSGYSVRLDLDTTSLINAGLLRADLRDLRVVRYNAGIYTELHRVYMTNEADRGLWFRLQENIAAGNSIENYYVYYANPSAGIPPADSNQVFLWYDDFSVNSLATYNNGRHLDLHGAGTSFMSYDPVIRALYFDTGDNSDAGIRLNFIDEQNVLIQCDVAVNLTYPNSGTFALSTKYRTDNNNVLAHISNGVYNSPQIGTDGTRNGAIADPPGDFYFPDDGNFYTFTFASGESSRIGPSRSDYFFWVNNILRASATNVGGGKSNNDGNVVFEVL
ncbi:MAG TPA: hypothetical protein PLM75_02325 [bacterium]|nr:hypothetical protein [bacterium]